eukprot:GHVH01004317.1.p1 GENE.GHVH01004317.1~~GHVH01004317.1.p1  ORF type:complete len:151 (+),score=21.27 GHVH01004317.1:18-470(+)
MRPSTSIALLASAAVAESVCVKGSCGANSTCAHFISSDVPGKTDTYVVIPVDEYHGEDTSPVCVKKSDELTTCDENALGGTYCTLGMKICDDKDCVALPIEGSCTEYGLCRVGYSCVDDACIRDVPLPSDDSSLYASAALVTAILTACMF